MPRREGVDKADRLNHRKQQRLPQMLIGIAMMAFPYFVPGVALMLGIGAALVGVLMIMLRVGM